MTTATLVRTRNPLETLSMNNQEVKRRRSTRLESKKVYEENDGDFNFTRGSKRKKVEAVAPEPAPAPKRTKKDDREDEAPVQRKTRRPMNFADTPEQPAKSKAQPKKEPRRRTRSSLQKEEQGESSINGADGDEMDLVGNESVEESRTRLDVSKEATKISIPFSDTPIINRNKELRKTGNGRRRSSLGTRGRRASSLIDSGQSATPHHEVESSQFYKHIESEGLSEPRRMKQLLIWCAERAVLPKPTTINKDNAAINSARLVQEGILKDFSTRSEMSDWFSREEPLKQNVVKVPNPINIENEERIKALEERIARLKAEKEEWKALMKTPPPLSPLFDPSAPPDAGTIDTSLLDPEDAALFSSLAPSSSSNLAQETEARLKVIRDGLEFKVDQFSDGIHKLGQARQTMEKVANKVMALSSLRLDEREVREKEAAGTRDMPIMEVLRALSRVMPESNQVGPSGSRS